MSVHAALEQALPHAAISTKRYDPSVFACGFSDFDALRPALREQILAAPTELESLRCADLASGHFSLETLRAVGPPQSVATVLREPRARLLSLYMYWRSPAGTSGDWDPYRAPLRALRPLDEYLADPELAQAIDNVVCRAMLHGDPRIPPMSFIADEDAESVAADASRQLENLRFTGILELSDEMWRGLSEAFGAPLSPAYINATPPAPSAGPVTLDAIASRQTVSLLERRTRADAIVYRDALDRAGHGKGEADALCASAFASELVRVGYLAGLAAAAQSPANAR